MKFQLLYLLKIKPHKCLVYKALKGMLVELSRVLAVHSAYLCSGSKPCQEISFSFKLIFSWQKPCQIQILSIAQKHKPGTFLKT